MTDAAYQWRIDAAIARLTTAVLRANRRPGIEARIDVSPSPRLGVLVTVSASVTDLSVFRETIAVGNNMPETFDDCRRRLDRATREVSRCA